MSWFSTLTAKVSESVAAVSDAVSNIDSDSIFEKLTLTTPELLAEKHRIEAEEKRKEALKDALARMMPWETHDEDRRDILVEECKEAILQLSHKKSTFYGPYQMPELKAKLDDDDEGNANEEEDDEDQDEDEDEEIDFTGNSLNPPLKLFTNVATATTEGGNDNSTQVGTASGCNNTAEGGEIHEKTANTLLAKPRRRKRIKDAPPTAESIEKLHKLEPLPALLYNFDFYMHVGLIQRMLAVDRQLVKMQSKYSGGGEREVVFWKNYFFHCAYTRYEAGLSIDEIWSYEALTETSGKVTSPMSSVTVTSSENQSADKSTTVADVQSTSAIKGNDKLGNDGATGIPVGGIQQQKETFQATKFGSTSPSLSDFEMVDTADDGDNAWADGTTDNRDSSIMPAMSNKNSAISNSNSGTVGEFANADSTIDDNEAITSGLAEVEDYELDELEAEIARELED